MLGDLFDSPWKILIIAVVVLVLFGSKKLPDAARSLGKSMRILKTEIHELHDDDEAKIGTVQTTTTAPVTTVAPAIEAQAPAPAANQQQVDALQQQLDELRRQQTVTSDAQQTQVS
jgi:sec-independent protein translocase protein TatA